MARAGGGVCGGVCCDVCCWAGAWVCAERATALKMSATIRGKQRHPTRAATFAEMPSSEELELSIGIICGLLGDSYLHPRQVVKMSERILPRRENPRQLGPGREWNPPECKGCPGTM